MSKKLKVIIVGIIAVLFVSPFVYGQIKSIQKKQTDYNKKRLIELSISREKNILGLPKI